MDFDTPKMHEFVDNFCKDPTLKEWKPSEYELKYVFSPTPRGQLKLAKHKEKEDAKLKALFDKECEAKAFVHKVVDEIATYPKDIADLFFKSFTWRIENLRKCHDNFLKLKAEISESYRNISVNSLQRLRHFMEKTTYDVSWSGRRTVRKTMNVLSENEWNDAASNIKGEFIQVADDKWEYEYPLKKVEDPKSLMQLLIKYYDAYDKDEVALKGDNAYQCAVVHMANVLNGILEEIKEHFNGNKPTQCLTPPTWGHRGEYCGILTDGTTKVSFKSFEAGGWNIVKYHFRFRITKLK